jgi:hypothetical protein
MNGYISLLALPNSPFFTRLTLLKADGRFAPLPIIASRNAGLGDTVFTLGFPDPGLQGFAPKVLAHGHHGGNRVAHRRRDDARHFPAALSYYQSTIVLGARQIVGRFTEG